MVILIPIKINHEKPITKVKDENRDWNENIGRFGLVGSGYYNKLEYNDY